MSVFTVIEGNVVLTDDLGNVIAVLNDGGVYRLRTETKLATGHGLATEATLASIKDTDGIKKITDQLPVGANLLGKVQIRNPGDTADLGSAASPVRIDPTGSTVQPVSLSTVPLPTGAATEATLATRATEATLATRSSEATLATRLSEAAFEARINTLGQKVMAASTPVVLASDQTVVPVSDNGASLTVDTPQLPAALVGGRLDQNIGAWLGSVAPTVGQKTMAASIPVVVSSDQVEFPIKQGTAAALAGAWPAKVTDGVNTMPTMDVAARAGYFRRTDGTNVTPAGDVVGRSVFQQVSDGTTGPVAVKPAATSPLSADKALVVVLSPNQQAIPVSSAPANSTPGIAYGRIGLGGGTAGTLQVIRGTVYTEPTAAAQRSIASSNAGDTAAGTGARTVLLTYYDNTGAGPVTETITLNGTTAVATAASDIRFIEKMVVTMVGSNQSNLGTLTLYVNNAGGGGVIGTLAVGSLVAGLGDNTTLWAHHYVAPSKTATLATFVVAAYSGGSGTNATFFLEEAFPLIANAADRILSEVLLITASFTRVLGIPIRATGFSRVTAYGIPGVNNVTLAASFDFSEQ